MVYSLEIRPLATIEIIAAYDWYEEQSAGLGLRFLEVLEHFFDDLILNPLTHSYYDEPTRQGKLKYFPYVVIYELFDDTIVVYSVFMTAQDPDKKRTG